MTQKTNFSSAANDRFDDYAPIARAIDYIVDRHDEHPSLEEIASVTGLSPTHFQRVFKSGAGVSPKRFLQYMAASNARDAIAAGENVMDAAFRAGLSGPSRLHDLFLVAEAMTPGAYKKKGDGVRIHFGSADGPFGRALIGATDKGICWLSFAGEKDLPQQTKEMRADWPAAEFVADEKMIAPLAKRAFAFAMNNPIDKPLGLHVQGTNFQLKVWEALLRIPSGALWTYGDLAEKVCTRRAARAVGAAVGANMISLLIPCHRVILSSGVIHNYRWGAERKRAILSLEMARAAA